MKYNVDLNLKLDLDDYLLKHDSFKFIKILFDTYNKNHSNVVDYHNQLYKDKYPLLNSFLDLVSLKRELDNDELFFFANIIYKQKGSIESVKMILDIVNCNYSINLEDGHLDLVIHYIDVTNVYLANVNLIKLCKDLLFFYSYEFTVEEVNVIYKLKGEVTKSYAVYQTFNIEGTSIREDSSQVINLDTW